MVIYVPGTEETDPKKQNMSLQAIAAAATTAIANIATNTTNIATNTSAITALQALGASRITASLGADVALNNISNYFDGPSVAQGSTGIWFASGTVTMSDTGGPADMFAKLWDGTTVIASGFARANAANFGITISLSGFISAPVGNLRISCRDASLTTGKILFNSSGNSKDSTISAYRIA